jgi:hypothetical protein
MIEDTARHAGHLDLLRDGSTELPLPGRLGSRRPFHKAEWCAQHDAPEGVSPSSERAPSRRSVPSALSAYVPFGASARGPGSDVRCPRFGAPGSASWTSSRSSVRPGTSLLSYGSCRTVTAAVSQSALPSPPDSGAAAPFEAASPVAEEVTGIGALGLLVPDRFAPELAGLLAQPACDTPCTFAAAPGPVARIRPDASATPTTTLRIAPRPWFMTVPSCSSPRYTGGGAAEISFCGGTIDVTSRKDRANQRADPCSKCCHGRCCAYSIPTCRFGAAWLSVAAACDGRVMAHP